MTALFARQPADAPLVGVSADRRVHDTYDTHLVHDFYLRALIEAAGVQPVILPDFADWYDPEAAIASLDGLVLTGSNSNIEPHNYGRPPSRPDDLRDPARDATVLPMTRAAVKRGLPLLGICRGLQELNVALGGTLHQEVHDVPGRNDHRSPRTLAPEQRFAPVHDVALTPGGILAEVTGRRALHVNSVHGQGIDGLAPGLAVEAMAADGQVEAVRVDACGDRTAGFALAVQWHPEWLYRDDPTAAAIFAAFGQAARAHARRRRQPVPA